MTRIASPPRPDRMRVLVRLAQGITWVQVTGDVADTAPAVLAAPGPLGLLDHLTAPLFPASSTMVLDLSGVTRIDAGGQAVLTACHAALLRQGWRVCLVGSGPHVLSPLDYAIVVGLLPPYGLWAQVER